MTFGAQIMQNIKSRMEGSRGDYKGGEGGSLPQLNEYETTSGVVASDIEKGVVEPIHHASSPQEKPKEKEPVSV